MYMPLVIMHNIMRGGHKFCHDDNILAVVGDPYINHTRLNDSTVYVIGI